MSIWIRALCTKSVGRLTAVELASATEALDFETMAEVHGLDESSGLAARQALRFELDPADTDATIEQGRLYYRPDLPERFVPFERWRGDRARDEATELAEFVEDREGPGGDRIRAVLARVVESVAFCLKDSDADGMGWPIAWHTAIALARRGDGLVEGEDTWWDPTTYETL